MSYTYRFIARLTAISMLVAPVGPAPWQALAAAQAQATGAQAKPAAKPSSPSASPAAATVPVYDWPRSYTAKSGARLTLYQPQIESWPEQKHVVLWLAVSYLTREEAKPALGTLKVESDTKVALSERLVRVEEFSITQANFPTLSKERLQQVVADITDSVPLDERVIPLDRVLAMVNTSEITPRNTEGVKADPPAIFFSQGPAVLVNLDGEPIWSPIDQNELRFAVNTNWDLFEHPPSKNFFLRVNDGWLVSTSVKGPWAAAGRLPDSFTKLPNDGNWAEVKAAIPGKPLTAATAPTVFVSTVPAELILASGAPRYQAVTGTNLAWLSNTESDIFRLGQSGPIYYLVAGRWFSASQFTGPWTFATPTLPEDFRKIPLEHPRSRVLASVPGTRQAIEAVLLAQVPQTARVKRSELKAPDVVYNGNPQFEPIAQTKVANAVNTDKQVFKVGDLYYMCFQGVWFRSTAATGPWVVADAVPPEIYEIPISSPAHNVTYVTVEDSDDDEVEFAAAAAYAGMMVAWGCAVWGTGWYYPPYYYPGFYPIYYPHYPTYGYGAWYNPWSGAYGRAGAVYGPYGGAGYAARYNPSTGRYSRGAVAYGPGGARGVAEAWNPRTGTYAQTRQGSNIYGSWGTTAVQRGDNWAATSRVTNRQTGTTTRVTQGSGGGEAITRRGDDGRGGVARTGSGDVYAGRDGNVYRNDGGGWQKYDNGSWNSVERPSQRPEGTTGQLGATTRDGTRQGDFTSTRDQLDRDRASRSDGSQRTRDLSSARSGSSSWSRGSSRSGSYRPSGGMRGGGGRRR